MKKKITLLAALAALLTFMLQSYDSIAQQTDDEKQIKEVLTNYIEGRNEGDLVRLKKAFHPSATLKFVVPETKELGKWSLEEYLRRLSPGQKLNCTGEIKDIHIFSDAAQATVILTYPTLQFYDYMNLLKVDGEWLITDKIFARQAR